MLFADGTIGIVPKSEDSRPKSEELPPEVLNAVAAFVEDLIARKFTTSAGKPFSEREISETIGMAQPTLNKLRNKKGFGVRTLLVLRTYTGQSIDAILGYAIPEREAANVAQLDELQKQIDALTAVVTAQAGQRPGPHSKAGKALEELARARRHAQGQRLTDERARKANEPVRKKGAA